MIEIEKGIPLPNDSKSLKGHRKYPFATMQIGDSFFALADTARDIRRLQASIVSSMGRFKPSKFTTQTTEDGVRCWRIA